MSREGSLALAVALTAELRRRLGDDAPVVSYAWSRAVVDGTARRVVMFARVQRDHQSAVIEASGQDGDEAYHSLLERSAAWAGQGSE